MPFKFEKLQIWEKALDLTIEISNLVKYFPAEEVYCLSKQMKRAADSVVLNIAEGSTGQTDNEQRQFLKYALRSAIEVVSCLFIARKKSYIENTTFIHFYSAYESLSKMINQFIKSLAITRPLSQ